MFLQVLVIAVAAMQVFVLFVVRKNVQETLKTKTLTQATADILSGGKTKLGWIERLTRVEVEQDRLKRKQEWIHRELQILRGSRALTTNPPPDDWRVVDVDKPEQQREVWDEEKLNKIKADFKTERKDHQREKTGEQP